MRNPLSDVYGTLLLVRPPVPVTVNKAGANYKSEVAHLQYSPRRAFDEWVSICAAITACGGDAVFDFEDDDEPFLGAKELRVAADGAIYPLGSSERLGHLDDVLTGRVFTANGPWVVLEDDDLRAVMPHMLSHRRAEAPYYSNLLELIAAFGGYDLEIIDNPHRWEGMADVAVVGERVALTYTVPGHYDQGLSPKSERSSREGVAFAADRAGVPEQARIYAELVYPHFHGDTVHFGARPTRGGAVLVHYPNGLWGDGAARVSAAIGPEQILAIGRDDAVEQYAGNSRQVGDGVLIPDGVSAEFERALIRLGLAVHRVPLFEHFGKAGGGPACATLYLPRNLALPECAPIRFSARRAAVDARRARLAERVLVDPDFFAGKRRG
jgi:hypothetical protein